MKMPVIIRQTVSKWLVDKGDPIEAEKTMISSIQKLVGIHNVCGDEVNENFTILSITSIITLAGAFLYVGTFSQTIYFVQVFPDKIECFKALNCISSTSVPLSKYIFMWAARSRLRIIFEMSHEGLSSIPDGTLAHKKMLKTLRTARFASWLVVFNQATVHIVYLLVPFLFTVFGVDRYLPTTPGDGYGLTPKYETPNFEITFVVTSIATAFSAINQTGYIVLFVNLLAHQLGYFYSISETLHEIYHIVKRSDRATENSESERNSVNEKLIFCMKHHQFLIKYNQKIRELYNFIFGAHFLMMTIVIVTTLQTMNTWGIQNSILSAAAGIMPLFIYCFGGELLIMAREEMSTALYTCGWEFMNVKQAKSILIMLCLSQKPLYLTAAGIFVMNRDTFGNVAQVVYKIYAVFN